MGCNEVSVPCRGLFFSNLGYNFNNDLYARLFPSPVGDYSFLIYVSDASPKMSTAFPSPVGDYSFLIAKRLVQSTFQSFRPLSGTILFKLKQTVSTMKEICFRPLSGTILF